MALEWTHKRYFQYHFELNDDSSQVNADGSYGPSQFNNTSAADVYALYNFPSVWNTGSPTKTYALEDSNKTLVVTYEFSSKDNEAAFITAVDAAYDDGSAFADNVRASHIKTEWFTSAGVEKTDTNIITESNFE